jgi:hypothetical protein
MPANPMSGDKVQNSPAAGLEFSEVAGGTRTLRALWHEQLVLGGTSGSTPHRHSPRTARGTPSTAGARMAGVCTALRQHV